MSFRLAMSANVEPVYDRAKAYENAVRDVEQGVTMYKAAKRWGIARSTLQDRCVGKYSGVGSGKSPILTVAEEERLADWLIERSKRGFGLSINEFLDSVQKFIGKDQRKTPFTGNRPGRKWYKCFLKRNPQIRLRNARPLDKKRAKISAADLDKWFTEFQRFIVENGLATRPAHIWNCDETGFDLQGKAGKILGPSAPKDQPYRVVTDRKEHITVLPCFNAAGQWIPPYILFAGKRAPVKYNPLEGGVPGSTYSLTDKGYMDTATFYMWLANHFIPNIPPARPVVLLVDSADSHLDLDTFELANKNQIYIFALLKNATHLMQPADVGLFGSMKQSWYKNVRRFTQKNPNTDITKKNFCAVFKSTWQDVMRPSILSEAFRKSGIYPVNRLQISDDQVRSSLVYASTSTSTGTVNMPSLSSEPRSFSLPEQSVSLDARPTPLTQSTECSIPQQNVSLDGRPTPLPQSSEFSLPEQNASLNAFKERGDCSGAGKTALDALESVLETPVKDKYRRRVHEGYNLDGSPTFQAWRKLQTAASQALDPVVMTPQVLTQQPRMQQPTSTVEEADNNAQKLPNVPFPESAVSPQLTEILTYPSAPDNRNPARTNVKRTLPNFLNSDVSMKLLRDAKLKKARELAAKQKKLREREEQKEAKKKEKEEKKREMDERREQKKSEKDAKKSEKVAKKRKAKAGTRTNKAKTWRSSLPQIDENSCKVCWQDYSPSDDENMPWVMCNECERWMHIHCVPFGVDTTTIDNEGVFFCHDCC